MWHPPWFAWSIKSGGWIVSSESRNNKGWLKHLAERVSGKLPACLTERIITFWQQACLVQQTHLSQVFPEFEQKTSHSSLFMFLFINQSNHHDKMPKIFYFNYISRYEKRPKVKFILTVKNVNLKKTNWECLSGWWLVISSTILQLPRCKKVHCSILKTVKISLNTTKIMEYPTLDRKMIQGAVCYQIWIVDRTSKLQETTTIFQNPFRIGQAKTLLLLSLNLNAIKTTYQIKFIMTNIVKQTNQKFVGKIKGCLISRMIPAYQNVVDN